MNAIVTRPPHRERSDDSARVTVDIEGGPPLWFEVPIDHEHLLSDRADHVAVGLLLPAMRDGRDLHVGGTVTDVLLHHLNGDLQDLMHVVAGHFRKVRVTADHAQPAAAPAAGVATGFSGGVDSFTVLQEFAFSHVIAPELQVTHLLFNNVGSHGEGGRDLWRRRHARLAEAAMEFGYPFVPVDSNLDEHYPRMGFLETVSLRNAAVAHALGGGIGRLLYASGFSYADVRRPDHGEISRIDTVVLPLLSTRAVALEPANPGMTRVRKTLAIANLPQVKWLDVCIAADSGEDANCSRCWKCMRTMLTLDIAGRLDEFCPIPFRRQPYRAQLSSYRAEVLASDDPQSMEIIRFAAERGWRWGAKAHVTAAVLRGRRRALRAARTVRKGLRNFARRTLQP